jgi:hypothetical protein
LHVDRRRTLACCWDCDRSSVAVGLSLSVGEDYLFYVALGHSLSVPLGDWVCVVVSFSLSAAGGE